jgi:hypothetical protein
MGQTKRERYEELEKWIQKTSDEWETKDYNTIPAAEVEVLQARVSEFKTLKRQLTQEYGCLPPWNVPANGGASKAYLSDLASSAGSGGFGGGGGYSSGDGYSNDVKSGPWGAEMKGYLERIGTKTITPSGSITVPSLSRGIVAASDRPTSVLQLIPFEKLENTDSFAYLQESVRTHAASTVAVGALKPTSVYSVIKQDDRVRVIATLSEPMDRSMLMDVALLAQYLEGSLQVGCHARARKPGAQR